MTPLSMWQMVPLALICPPGVKDGVVRRHPGVHLLAGGLPVLSLTASARAQQPLILPFFFSTLFLPLVPFFLFPLSSPLLLLP